MSFTAVQGCSCYECSKNYSSVIGSQAPPPAYPFKPAEYIGPTCSECDQQQAQYYYLCGHGQKCSSCCECDSRMFCMNCGDQTHDYCESHQHGDCCCDCPKSALTPGWVRRGEHEIDVHERVVRSEIKPKTYDIDPIQSMADFYLTDYVLFVTSKVSTSWNCVDDALRREGIRAPRLIRRDAKVHQNRLVKTLDEAFRNYVFMALGGEVRHHPAIQNHLALPKSRGNAWDHWLILGDVVGRAPLLEDVVELFEDEDGWRSGFGGEAWALPARLMLAREQGKLDARTWVDRVFTLEHNGGSLLDKVGWGTSNKLGWHIGFAKTLGDAHASNPPNFSVLLECASSAVVGMYNQLRHHAWLIPYRHEYEAFNKAVDHALCDHVFGAGFIEDEYVSVPWHTCHKCRFSQSQLEVIL